MKCLPPRLGTIDTRRLKPAPRDNDEFYHSKDWRGFIARLINIRGRRCEDPVCTTPQRGAGGLIFGDHVEELKDGGARLDPSNVLLRCGPCHNRKTARARGSRAHQRMGEQG